MTKTYQLVLTEDQINVLKTIVEFHVDNDEGEDYYDYATLKTIRDDLQSGNYIELFPSLRTGGER